ncbi:MAG: hypothetical protein QNK37_17810 [Acidobacteriota bacterium]|nr:hypothetical protein [Acidobacteriota bacterium]
MSNATVQFLDYQKPALEAGDYTISVRQEVEIPAGIPEETFYGRELHFKVQGERFSLNPEVVHAVFPPSGSLGRHHDCLPHIALTRSTFPWERSAYPGDSHEPWLALLLFDEEEIEQEAVVEKIITLGDLKTSTDADFPPLTLETGQQGKDSVTVVDIARDLFEAILPGMSELKFLAHVRRRQEQHGASGEEKRELAIVMGNRLPRAGARSTLHLVSLEERFKGSGEFDFKTNQKPIRLVSLYSWRFACLDQQNFETLVEELQTGIVRLPNPGNEAAVEPYLARGYVPISHRLRQGDRTYSWYHGPLATCDSALEFTDDSRLPTLSDALIRYHRDIGLLDMSYAAAFELGRVLALEDGRFHPLLYQWKHQYNERLLPASEAEKVNRLVAPRPGSGDDRLDSLAAEISAWLAALARLEGLPFSYLLPDETMLPEESMRFFYLDRHWLECLLHGAFSVGPSLRKLSAADNTRTEAFGRLTAGLLDEPRTGFIVRSELISGYPDIRVEGYPTRITHDNPLSEKQTLERRRFARIGPQTLLCIFAGEVETVEFFLEPQGLHYGLDEEPADGGSGWRYEKDIQLPGSNLTVSLSNPIRAEDKRVLHITGTNGIAEQIGSAMGWQQINPAQFALHMLEGSNKGRFVISL